MAVDAVWEMRYHRAASELSISTQTPIYPRDGYQAAASPPMLGLLPVVVDGANAYNYHVQISRNHDFTAIVDEAYAAFGPITSLAGKDAGRVTCRPAPIGGACVRKQPLASSSRRGSEPRRFDLDSTC